MIRSGYVRANKGSIEPGAQRGADQKVINAPADIARACTGHRTPPGVMPAARFEFAEPRALLRRETVIVDVGLGVGEVNFSVGHVEIATENHRLFLFELLKVAKKVQVPLLAVSETREFAL